MALLRVHSKMYVDESNAEDRWNCTLLHLHLKITWFVQRPTKHITTGTKILILSCPAIKFVLSTAGELRFHLRHALISLW